MNPDQTPPPAARAALESLYYDQATELCDLCPLAESGDDRMHGMHLAIMEALADAHEAGQAEVITGDGTDPEVTLRELLAETARVRALLCTDGTLTAAVGHLGSILHDAGIGLPACDRAPTCQSLHLSTRIHDLADQRDAARRELAAIDTAITATGHPPGDGYNPLRLVRELLAKVPPAPTIGGPMPEPWPGMGVEVEGGGMILVPFILARDGDDWIGLPAKGAPSLKSCDVVAVYDGRDRIWQRNP